MEQERPPQLDEVRSAAFGRGAALAVGAAVSALFWILRPKFMLYWDEVQLTLALNRFDLVSHQPHPPGYYVFVLLGRIFRPLVAEPPDALRLVSILASGATVALIGWVLPRDIAKVSRIALLAAVAILAVASPVLLPFGVLALTYAPLAATWLAVLLWSSRRPRGFELLCLGAFTGLCGGVHEMMLVWAIAVWILLALGDRRRIRAADVLLAGSGLAAGVLVWVLPMLHEVGGWNAYARATSALARITVRPRTVFAVGPGPVLALRLPRMLADLWSALGPVLLLPLVTLFARLRRRPSLARWDALPLGAAVGFLFYLCVIYDSSGYIVPVAVPLSAYGVLGLGILVQSRRARSLAAVAPLLAVALSVMPGGIARRDEEGYRRLLRNDRMTARRIEAIRDRFDPGETVLVTSLNFWVWNLRHTMYYLPEFTVVQLSIDPSLTGVGPESPYIAARADTLRYLGPDPLDLSALPEFARPPGLRNVVCLIPRGLSGFVEGSCASRVRELRLGPEETLAVLHSDGSTRFLVHRERLSCRPF